MRVRRKVAVFPAVMLALSGITLTSLPQGASAAGSADIRITEWEYNGSEFVELTNVGTESHDLTGWSFSDSARTPGNVSLSGFGTVAAGESVILSEATAAAFRTEWSLPTTVKVVGGNTQNLGRSDEINIYDATSSLVDRLTYNDQGTGDVKGPRTDTASAWVNDGEPRPQQGKHLDPLDGRRCRGIRGPPSADSSALPASSTLGAGPTDPEDPPVDPPAEPTVKINEIESNGDKVADWVELVNTGTADADVSGWKILDNDPAHVATPVVVPANTTIPVGGHYAIYTEIAQSPGFGLGGNDSVTLFKADGSTVVDTYAWTAHAATTFGRCPDGTGDFALTTTSTRGLANACSPVRINEVESSGGDPGDWVELVNVSDAPVDLTGWTFKDNGEPGYTIPSGSIAAHGYFVLNEANTGIGLGGGDSARLFDNHGVLAESYTWAAHATTTYGRCKDALGDFTTTVAPTKGTVNTCPGLNTDVWPGDQVVHTSDLESTFVQDLSGLAFDPSDSGVLWAAQNKKGTLFKLVRDGANWVPAAGWPKDPKYTNGSGAPDTEGITVGPDGTVYLASERNNDASGVSRSSILSYDPNGSTTATHEWDVTGLIPANGANLGLEGITWIPDSYLTGNGFKDENTGQAYNPADYPQHGTGVFAVAVEDSGNLHLFALPSNGGAPTKLATVASGFPHLADVSFDPERQRLWAVTDDTHDGKTSQLKITGGAFVVDTAYDRPAGMPNINNEGLAIAPQSTCVNGKKEAVWADDGDTDGHSLRSGTIACTALPHNPKITAAAAGARAPSGWYRSNVTVTFTCTPQGSPLAGPCPAPVVLTASAADQTATGTISSVDGGTASVTVDNIDIDKVKPTVALGNAPDPRKYAGALPKPTCQGSDALSGIDTCTVTETHPSSLTTVFTAKAVDKAGNESTKPITYATLKVTTYKISFVGIKLVITPVTSYIVIPKLF